MARELEKPECRFGYTEEQIKRILGYRINMFHKFMVGQTMAICDGKLFDEATGQYVGSNCGPHGSITYAVDLHQFLANLPPLD
jgi:hypothetical protein